MPPRPTRSATRYLPMFCPTMESVFYRYGRKPGAGRRVLGARFEVLGSGGSVSHQSPIPWSGGVTRNPAPGTEHRALSAQHPAPCLMAFDRVELERRRASSQHLRSERADLVLVFDALVGRLGDHDLARRGDLVLHPRG